MSDYKHNVSSALLSELAKKAKAPKRERSFYEVTITNKENPSEVYHSLYSPADVKTAVNCSVGDLFDCSHDGPKGLISGETKMWNWDVSFNEITEDEYKTLGSKVEYSVSENSRRFKANYLNRTGMSLYKAWSDVKALITPEGKLIFTDKKELSKYVDSLSDTDDILMVDDSDLVWEDDAEDYAEPL